MRSLLIGAFLFLNHGIIKAETDQSCLAKTIYREARGESRLGQTAVGQVILNRIRAGMGSTVCKVVHSNQFNQTRIHIPKDQINYYMVLASTLLSHQSGIYFPPNLLFFNNKPLKIKKTKLYKIIGRQRFYLQI
jgi:hypothetical protein